MLNPQDLVDSVGEDQQKSEEERTEQARLKSIEDVKTGISERIVQATNAIVRDANQVKTVKVQNDLASPKDIKSVVSTLKQLGKDLKPESVEWGPVLESLSELSQKLDKLPTEYPEAADPVEDVSVKNLSDVKTYIQPLIDEIKKLELNPVFDPKIQVKPADVNVTTEKVDTKPLVTAIGKLQKGFEALAAKNQETDLSPLVTATIATTEAIQALRFPVANYVLPFKDENGEATQVSTVNGGVPIYRSYGIARIYDDTDPAYYGFEDVGGNWYVLREKDSDGTWKYARGAGGIATVWINNSDPTFQSLTYTDKGVVF